MMYQTLDKQTLHRLPKHCLEQHTSNCDVTPIQTRK